MAGSEWQSVDLSQCERATWVSADVKTRQGRKVIRFTTLSMLLKFNTKTIRFDALDHIH